MKSFEEILKIEQKLNESDKRLTNENINNSSLEFTEKIELIKKIKLLRNRNNKI